MFAGVNATKTLRQVYRVINMLRCKKEISRMWMYSEAGECDSTLPMSRLRVVQPSTCITRPSLVCELGAHGGKHSLCYVRLYRVSKRFLAREALDYALCECRMHCF
jgi:hypothetical protein